MSNSIKRKPAHLQIGEEAEEHAYQYLTSEGLILLERNYNTRFGEIDLIMQDGLVLVFIEVRYRKSTHYGGAAASIGYQKQQRIRRTAASYLQKKGNNCPARFDVIAIHGNMQTNWIKSAF